MPTSSSLRILFCLLLALLRAGGLREAVEVADLELESSLCGGFRCSRAQDKGRLNQGRFQLKSEDAQRVSWRLLPEASYSLQRDAQCGGDAENLVSSVSLVPWIHADDPINSSTIEIYVPAIEDLNLRMSGPQDIYVCASKTFRQERTCVCQLDLTASPTPGLLARAGQHLPTPAYAQIAKVQVSLDRLCSAPWIPDAVVTFMSAILFAFLIVCVEAALASRRTGEAKESGKPALTEGFVISGPLALVQTGAAGAVGFVTLMATTQGIAVAKAVEARLPEALVWVLVVVAGLLSTFAVWRSFQSICQLQLCQAYLQNGLCVRNSPSVAHMDHALAAGILVYALTVAGGILLAPTTKTERASLLILAVTALVGPVVNLLLRVKDGTAAEEAAAQVKMDPSGLEDICGKTAGVYQRAGEARAATSWSFVHWEEVLRAGREGREVRAESPAKQETAVPFALLRDIGWQRHCLYRLTGSRAAFLVWPGCCFSLALALASTAMQGLLFTCSRGELTGLQVTGLSGSLHFAPGQDRYLLGADQSVRQVSLLASANEVSTTLLTAEPPLARSRASALVPVPIGGMSVPRVARVMVQGMYPGLPATEYLVRFAPQAKLAQALVIEEANLGFRRCLTWGTLPGSVLSIPPKAKYLNATILFADFVLSVPLAKDQAKNLEVAADATWTVFDMPGNTSTCIAACRDDPDCLESFEGTYGCFGAHHSHAWHESQKCTGAARVDSEVRDKFTAKMFGCATNASRWNAQCGVGKRVQNQTAVFKSVQPDWQGGLSASLRLQLKREQGLESQPSDAQAITLYRDLPLPTDVLVKLLAKKIDNTTVRLKSRGMVSKAGNIVILARRFDPLQFHTLRVIVAPILPDQSFKVRWLSIPNDGSPMEDSELPEFKRCNKSNFLRQRYRACGASSPSARQTEPMNFSFISWVRPSEARFVVEPRDPAEQKAHLWPVPRQLKLEVKFQKADTPAAWAAEDLGCGLLQRVHRSSMNFVARSAGAFCAMVKSAIATQQCDYDHLCEAWETALAEHSRLPTAQVTTLLACQAMAQTLPWKTPCKELSFSPWEFKTNDHTIARTVVMPTYACTVDMKVSDFFESLATFHSDLLKYGLVAADALCRAQNWKPWAMNFLQQAIHKNRTDKPVNPGSKPWFYWMSRAIRTGSNPLTRTIHKCLVEAHASQGFVLQGAIDARAEALADEAWGAVSAHAGQDGFNQLSWLRLVGNLSAKMPEALVTSALQRESMPGFRESMELLLPEWKSCTEVSPSLPRRKEMEDLSWVLRRHPCDQVKTLNISGGRFEDSAFPHDACFFGALQGLKQLRSLSIKHWSLSDADMASLGRALKNRTAALDLLELTPRLGEQAFPIKAFKFLFGLCVRSFEFGDIALRNQADVDSFSSEIAQAKLPCLRRMRIDVTGLSDYILLKKSQPLLQDVLRKASGNATTELVISDD